MPSGHASHKGTSNKPNTNADGVIDDAAKMNVDPDEVIPYEGADALRAAEAPNNTKATQREES